MKNAIEQFGLTERVCHLGYVEKDELQAIYKLATALVMPSLFESVSIPIYEAFQVGTPVAASNILAIPEQVGDAGLLFDPKSVASIKEAILRIVKRPADGAPAWKKGQDRMSAMTSERYGAQLQDVIAASCDRARHQQASKSASKFEGEIGKLRDSWGCQALGPDISNAMAAEAS